MEMEVTAMAVGNTRKLALRGRLDTAGVDRIETRFSAASVAAGLDTLVDLSEVELITSMGIRMLIGAARAMGQRKTQLVLFGARALVLEALEMAAIDSLIPLAADEAGALALLQRRA